MLHLLMTVPVTGVPCTSLTPTSIVPLVGFVPAISFFSIVGLFAAGSSPIPGDPVRAPYTRDWLIVTPDARTSIPAAVLILSSTAFVPVTVMVQIGRAACRERV